MDDSVQHFHRVFEKEFVATVGDRDTVRLKWPSLEYSGWSAAGTDLPMMSWTATIKMYVDDDNDFSETYLPVGFLHVHTMSLSGNPAETLDAVSTDTAAYVGLFEGADLSDAVGVQFGFPMIYGLIVLDRAYVVPALRNRDIGAWAAVQAVHDLSFGSPVFVAACPTPIEDRPGQSRKSGADLLARHWEKAGLKRIAACPELIGHTTDGTVFADAREALLGVGEIEDIFQTCDLRSTGQVAAAHML